MQALTLPDDERFLQDLLALPLQKIYGKEKRETEVSGAQIVRHRAMGAIAKHPVQCPSVIAPYGLLHNAISLARAAAISRAGVPSHNKAESTVFVSRTSRSTFLGPVGINLRLNLVLAHWRERRCV